MLFKEFFFEKEVVDQFDENLYWAIQSNTSDLIPLHLLSEAEDNEKIKYPSLTTIAPGDSNPKTAKHPETDETYMGAVLHLEPYAGSGEQVCPFATAIYKITAKNLDPETLQKISLSPGYQKVRNLHVFYGFEIRFGKQNIGGQETNYGSMSNMMKSPAEQKMCPMLMKIKLANTSLRDWSGPHIDISRNQIVHTELVGGCANSCLHFSGDPQRVTTKLTGRRKKTLEFTANNTKFMSKVLLDLFKLVSAATNLGHKPVVRMNATSDISWESDVYRFSSDPAETESILREVWPTQTVPKFVLSIKQAVHSSASKFVDIIKDVASFVSGRTLLEVFPNVIFYDYTKNPARMHQFLLSKRNRSSWPSNYYLTFSLAEDNREQAIKFLKRGGTIAAVFNVKGGRFKDDLPATWMGFKVIDGDKHDYRFLDEKGVVVGLRAKGEAQYEETDFGFVIQPNDPGLDSSDPAVANAIRYKHQLKRRIDQGLRYGPGEKKKKYTRASQEIGYDL